jgi:hypothetical protein
MAITLRSVKGSPLTHTELDTNFNELDKIPNGKVFPKDANIGIKIDVNAPNWGWHDIPGHLHSHIWEGFPAARHASFIGGVDGLAFQEGEEAFCQFHLPHDYAPGTDLFIHVHWSHNGTNVTGGSVTWVFETTYAKGHGQDTFKASKLVPTVATVDSTQYKHYVTESALSVAGGSPNQLNTTEIETDGIIACRLYLDSNDMTISGGVKPDCMVFFVDVHYQSTGLPTKNKAPNFWN